MIEYLNFISQQRPGVSVYWRIPGINQRGVALEVRYDDAIHTGPGKSWTVRAHSHDPWEHTDSEGVWMKAVEQGADIYEMRQTIYKTVRALIVNRLFSKGPTAPLEKSLEIPARAEGAQPLKHLLRTRERKSLSSQTVQEAFYGAYHKRILH